MTSFLHYTLSHFWGINFRSWDRPLIEWIQKTHSYRHSASWLSPLLNSTLSCQKLNEDQHEARFILPASKFQHVLFSKEHFKETTPKSLFLCFTFFFLFLEMFTSIPYFFQIYCGFSDIRLCKMPCREYCLRHLFFIISFYLALAYEWFPFNFKRY